MYVWACSLVNGKMEYKYGSRGTIKWNIRSSLLIEEVAKFASCPLPGLQPICLNSRYIPISLAISHPIIPYILWEIAVRNSVCSSEAVSLTLRSFSVCSFPLLLLLGFLGFTRDRSGFFIWGLSPHRYPPLLSAYKFKQIITIKGKNKHQRERERWA